MPKLNDEIAEVVDNAESTGGLMEDGIYPSILHEVQDTKDGKPLVGEKGPYWQWVFKNAADAEKYPNWQHWRITSLSPDSAWVLKDMFAAFGVSPDTDTDELIGRPVRIEVGTRTVQKGARAGELQNFTKSVLPADDTDASTDSADTKGSAKNKADAAKAKKLF